METRAAGPLGLACVPIPLSREAGLCLHNLHERGVWESPQRTCIYTISMREGCGDACVPTMSSFDSCRVRSRDWCLESFYSDEAAGASEAAGAAGSSAGSAGASEAAGSDGAAEAGASCALRASTSARSFFSSSTTQT